MQVQAWGRVNASNGGVGGEYQAFSSTSSGHQSSTGTLGGDDLALQRISIARGCLTSIRSLGSGQVWTIFFVLILPLVVGRVVRQYGQHNQRHRCAGRAQRRVWCAVQQALVHCQGSCQEPLDIVCLPLLCAVLVGFFSVHVHVQFGTVDLCVASTGSIIADKPLMVAVKSLSGDEDSLVADFVKEAKIMTKLRHPNLVSILGVCMDEHPYLMVLEYLEGGTLEDWLDLHTTTLGPDAKLWILHQVASGAGALHTAGVVHRDIAARNVLIGTDFCVKLADFGLSRDLAAGSGNTEYVHAHTRIDARADTRSAVDPGQLGAPALRATSGAPHG